MTIRKKEPNRIAGAESESFRIDLKFQRLREIEISGNPFKIVRILNHKMNAAIASVDTKIQQESHQPFASKFVVVEWKDMLDSLFIIITWGKVGAEQEIILRG